MKPYVLGLYIQIGNQLGPYIVKKDGLLQKVVGNADPAKNVKCA